MKIVISPSIATLIGLMSYHSSFEQQPMRTIAWISLKMSSQFQMKSNFAIEHHFSKLYTKRVNDIVIH